MIRSLLLCGGSGSRFGGGKLVAKRGDRPIGWLAARSLLAGTGDALAIVRAGDETLAAVLREAGCEVLSSEACEKGLGASLAAGVAATRTAGGWLVALGDMPLVSPATHAAVKAAMEAGAPLAAAVDRTSGRRGHPVAFSRELGDELAVLDGDEGARSVVERHGSRLVRVPVDDHGIFLDIDTPEDLEWIPP